MCCPSLTETSLCGVYLYIVVFDWSILIVDCFIKVFQMKPGKVYKIRSKNQPMVTVWTVEDTAMCFWSSLSQRFAAVCWLLACLCNMNSHSPSYRETDLGFEAGGVTLSAIFTRFGAQLFSLLAPAGLCVTSLQIGLRRKRGCWKSGW